MVFELCYSNYHSLQATLTKRVTHGLSFTAGYTYGHGLDDGSESRYGPLPQVSANPRVDYASGDFDVRHRVTLTASYEFPGKKALASYWKAGRSTPSDHQSAQPWNIGDTSNDFSGGGDLNDRWDFLGTRKISSRARIPFPTARARMLAPRPAGISGASFEPLTGGPSV